MEQKTIETVGPRVEPPSVAPEQQAGPAAITEAPRPQMSAVARYRHIQSPGIYVKMTQVPKGLRVYSKQLPEDHVVILAHGKLHVDLNGQVTVFSAPASYVIPANTRVQCVTMEESVWYCVHATDETDLEKLKALY